MARWIRTVALLSLALLALAGASPGTGGADHHPRGAAIAGVWSLAADGAGLPERLEVFDRDGDLFCCDEEGRRWVGRCQAGSAELAPRDARPGDVRVVLQLDAAGQTARVRVAEGPGCACEAGVARRTGDLVLWWAP